MEAEDVTNLFAFLIEHYPSMMPITEPKCAAWLLVLLHQNPQEIMLAAVKYASASNPFPPSAGQLIELAKDPSLHKAGSEAWEEVIAEVRRKHYYGKPEFHDEKILRCIGFLGGWEAVASQLVADVPSNRARFIEHYDNLASKEFAIDAHSDAESLLHHIEGPLLQQFGLQRMIGQHPKCVRDDDPTEESAEDRHMRLWEQGELE